MGSMIWSRLCPLFKAVPSINLSNIKKIIIREKKSWERRESSPGPLGAKRKRYPWGKAQKLSPLRHWSLWILYKDKMLLEPGFELSSLWLLLHSLRSWKWFRRSHISVIFRGSKLELVTQLSCRTQSETGLGPFFTFRPSLKEMLAIIFNGPEINFNFSFGPKPSH